MKKIVLTVVLLVMISFSLYADDHNPIRKLGRGASNVFFSIVEVPRQMQAVREESGVLSSLTYGLVKGFACFVGRTAVGAYEAITFPIPTYKPLVEPEFILNDVEEDTLGD